MKRNLRIIYYIYILTIIASGLSCSFFSEQQKFDYSITFEDGEKAHSSIFQKWRINPKDIGYILFDPYTKEVITKHNSRKAFIPASTMKIATIAMAINTFGPNHRFSTELRYSGFISGDTLVGDIYLIGKGDPYLEVHDVISFMTALKAKGIKKIQGLFYYDDTYLSNTDKIDSAMSVDAGYNTSVSALSMDYNSFHAQWYKYWNRKIKFFVTPELPFIKTFIDTNKKLEKYIRFTFKKQKQMEIWKLNPNTKKSGRQRLPVKQPSLFTAHMFKFIAHVFGIDLGDPYPKKAPKNLSLLYNHKSKPLIKISETCLVFSINLMAELLMLQSGKSITDSKLSLHESGKEVKNFYATRFRSISWKNCTILNGSGLSSKNRITPEQMLAITLFADAQNYGEKTFMTLLPIAGWRWSLLKRFNRKDTTFRVWAKTGGIDYVRSLAGILLSHSGKRLMFVMFTNDINKRNAYEKNPKKKSKKIQKKVWAWINWHTRAMDGIITEWIKKY